MRNTHGTSNAFQQDGSHQHHESGCKAGNCSQKIPKTIYGCTVESHESTRQRVESSVPASHEDHNAGKGYNSMTRYNLAHKFIPMPEAMKNPDAKAAANKEWKKLETTPAWQLGKFKSKKEIILEAQRDKRKVHFASLMEVCHLKNAELEPKLQKYKGRVVLRGDIVKDDPGAYAVFTEEGSSASQVTAAKVMDVTARLPDCDGQAADAVSAYTHRKMEDASTLQKNPKSECSDVWIRLPPHKWRNPWQTWKIPWYFSNEICMASAYQDFYGKDNSRKFCWMGKRTELGMSVCSSKTKINVIGLCG